ncbi:phosphoribosyl 1,2-cyclic phosphate phosphodiesterase [Roseinatronobacter thiooxidans]|uniref:Phosphoribosyl 1,2-cyclic phosphate phosphodiesterase n=1 Tax=Roseinatronobacter thiooxidans TaxID=121821 RepID=A0A2W7QID6_9RHOB|nr:MBL fold metallo-hydrolase [Roseinatronobacter thiooxidans]PZX48244.1 phosphoribosyl 1,2-cyclic phosphate phosphodiesterase [Roseinatronobacter thiooxidans]
MAELRATILGCGSSGGVPRLGGDWGACDPANPRNTRRRCSLLLERVTDAGRTQVLIDTSPDMRAQLLDAGIGRLDAVVFTHSHADHVHGIDDLRQIVFNTRERLAVWADGATQDALYSRFGYAFTQPAGSPYPPILDMHTIDGAITIDGAGGPLTLHPLRLNHGSIDALGFRVGGLAYTPDVVMIYPESWPMLQGLDLWIVDALRRKPHPTHAHLDMALDWIAQARPARAVLTNMHVDLDYATVAAETPDHVTPAHDGMVLTLQV